MVTFVDTNVFVYAVGREHPLRDEARSFFKRALAEAEPLATSAEVLQELLHVYLPVGRSATLDAALELVRNTVGEIWELEADDVLLARSLADRHPHLGARDLAHLASCLRRDVSRAKSFDRSFAAAFEQR